MPKTPNQHRQDRERSIVRGLIRALKAGGWNPDRVYDGGDEDIPTKTETAMMEAAFAVDESSLWFVNADGTDLGVFIVCGNDTDIISDYHTGHGFGELIDAYCASRES